MARICPPWNSTTDKVLKASFDEILKFSFLSRVAIEVLPLEREMVGCSEIHNANYCPLCEIVEDSEINW